MLKSSWRWAVTATLIAGCGGQPSKASLTGTSSGSTGHTSTATGGAGAGSTTAHVTTGTNAGPGSSSSSNGATGTTSANTNGETSQGNTTSGSSTGLTTGNASATTGTTTATTGVGVTTTATAGAAATTNTGGATSGNTSGACYPDGSFVGLGNGSLCCSGTTDNTDYCSEPGQGTLTSTGGTTATTEGTTTGDSSTTTAGTTAGTAGGSSGSTGATCPVSCYSARGYHCENGQCVLNGSDGDVQVTLQWDTSLQPNNKRAREDLDLHVVDPSGCEMWYGSHVCGNGSLDLDQNSGCSQTDNQGGYGNDTENVIYDGGAPSGTYTVIVDDWSDSCGGSPPNPFNWQLTIRAHGASTVYSGQFHLGNADSSGALCGWNGTQCTVTDTSGHVFFTFTN
ncbi:MAG: hypothetical protein JST54_10495 [Deltaproteobacteria bacterium]|nr:hypothetical protein [Deltaproteobacteria bacterium]